MGCHQAPSVQSLSSLGLSPVHVRWLLQTPWEKATLEREGVCSFRDVKAGTHATHQEWVDTHPRLLSVSFLPSHTIQDPHLGNETPSSELGISPSINDQYNPYTDIPPGQLNPKSSLDSLPKFFQVVLSWRFKWTSRGAEGLSHSSPEHTVTIFSSWVL